MYVLGVYWCCKSAPEGFFYNYKKKLPKSKSYRTKTKRALNLTWQTFRVSQTMPQWLNFRADKTPVKLAVINSLCSSLTAERADRCWCVSVCVCVSVSEDLSRPGGQLGLFVVATTTWNTDDDDGDNNSIPSKKKKWVRKERERENISAWMSCSFFSSGWTNPCRSSLQTDEWERARKERETNTETKQTNKLTN